MAKHLGHRRRGWVGLCSRHATPARHHIDEIQVCVGPRGQRIGADPDPASLGDQRLRIPFGEPLAVLIEQPRPGAAARKIPLPRRFSASPSSVSTLIAFGREPVACLRSRLPRLTLACAGLMAASEGSSPSADRPNPVGSPEQGRVGHVGPCWQRSARCRPLGHPIGFALACRPMRARPSPQPRPRPFTPFETKVTSGPAGSVRNPNNRPLNFVAGSTV